MRHKLCRSFHPWCPGVKNRCLWLLLSLLLIVYGAGLGKWHCLAHRPYSCQVTERMECNVVIHPPPSVYPKTGNGALRDQWAIKYYCQNDSPTIVFTARNFVHGNYVTSENIPRVCKSWKWLLIYVFATYIFWFIRHSLHWNKLPVNCGMAASIVPLMDKRGVTVITVIPTWVWVNRIVLMMTI